MSRQNDSCNAKNKFNQQAPSKQASPQDRQRQNEKHGKGSDSRKR